MHSQPYPIDTVSNAYRCKKKQTPDTDGEGEGEEKQKEKKTSDRRIFESRQPIAKRRLVGNVAGLWKKWSDGKVTANRIRLRVVSEAAP